MFIWILAPLAELTAPGMLDFGSIASAAGKAKGKGNGNAGGNGNGNAGGNGNGKANGVGNGKDDGDAGGGSGDFHDEGFGPPGLSLGGKDSLPPGRALGLLKGGDHTSKDPLRDDIDLGETFDLPEIDGAITPDAAELSKLLDLGKSANPNSASADKRGNGPPEEKRGNGSREDKPGNGPPDHAQANGLKKEKTKGPPGLASDAEDLPQAADRRTDAAGIDLDAIAPGSYESHDVLALELGSAALTRVRQLGFALDDRILSHATGGIIRLVAPARLDAIDALALLRRELPGEQFYLNRLYHSYLPADKEADGTRPGAGGTCPADRCYGKAVIRWKEALSQCARSLRIGVIDTGADLLHPAFAGRRITQTSFIPPGMQSGPVWHGTGVLALLAGAPDGDTPGLIPDASFFSAGIFFTNQAGSAVTDTISLLRAFEWMTKSGVQIINMSFAGPSDALVLERIKAMRAQGVVFVAAAGNEGPAARPTYPAAYPEVLAVTAVNRDLHVFPFAGRGPHIDVAAPGVDIWTAIPEGRAGFRTGTSFAAPFVTAVLAIESPDLFKTSKAEWLDKLPAVNLGPNGRDPIFGRGLVQAPPDCASRSETVSSWTPVAPLPK